MKENSIKDSHDIETEYLGSEETEYEEYSNIQVEETEYIESKTGKIPKDIILNQRYKIVETIGRGGMGAVYKALDIRLRNTPVAIKEMSLETIEEERIEKVIENFENEAQTLISLRHNAIPRVMDFFSLTNNKCYIVMDLIDGQTLDEVIKIRGAIPENEVRDWVYKIAQVLKYLHSRQPKIIFRDLKPSNVMLTKENEIKLIDFGIARTFKEDKSMDTAYYVSQGFSPPEQYGTGQTDERSDIYSLGALTYSLLIGRKPKIKDFKFEDLKNYIQVSEELNDAIMMATDFRPENRPQTIDEFLSLLNRNEEKTISNKSIFNNQNKKILAIASMVLLLLVGSKFNQKQDNNDEVSNEVVANSTYDEVNTDTTKENITEIKDDIDEEDENIKKAIEAIYESNGLSEEEVKYKYSPDDNYVKEADIKEDYYIFIERNSPDTDYETWADHNILVNKETFEVYIYNAGGELEKYESSEPLYEGEDIIGKYQYEKYNKHGVLLEASILDISVGGEFWNITYDTNYLQHAYGEDGGIIERENVTKEMQESGLTNSRGENMEGYMAYNGNNRWLGIMGYISQEPTTDFELVKDGDKFILTYGGESIVLKKV